MDTLEAVQLLQQNLTALVAMPRYGEDTDPFTRWRVQTNVALRTLLGQTAPEVKQFCVLTYHMDAAATEEVTPQQQEANRQALVTLLETVSRNLSLASEKSQLGF